MEENKKFYKKIFQEHDHFSLLSDTKLLTEDGWSFDVHQIILANKSIFFHDLFCNFPNDKEPILIPKFRGETLNEVLYFIYTDSVTFSKRNFLDIIIASDFFQIKELHNLAKRYAESILSSENCLQIFATSRKINEDRLRDLSFRVIQSNFERLRHEEPFAELPFGCIKEILKDNSLLVSGENVIWESATKWASRDPPNRFKEVCCLLKCLKLEDVDELLAEEIIKSDLISNNPYCSELEWMTLQKFECSLDTLKYIINISSESSETSLSKNFNRRLPHCINVIICLTADESDPGIYVTYDEELDLWRKVGEFEDYGLTSCVHIIGSEVYAFDFYNTDAKIFSLCTQEWYEMENSFDDIQSMVWCSVIMGSNIYFISDDLVDDKLKVKIYNAENGLWSDAMPMYRLFDFQAVSLLNKIFVVGHEQEYGALHMLTQVYEEETNSWSFITPPSIYRSNFYLTVYHEKLYLIGGVDFRGEFISNVEVFDVARNKWERIHDLPLSEDVEASFSSVLIFNDQLFAIFYVDIYVKQFVLNETAKTWIKPEKTLPVEDLDASFEEHLNFHTIYDPQIINILVKESRHPNTILEKSPFR